MIQSVRSIALRAEATVRPDAAMPRSSGFADLTFDGTLNSDMGLNMPTPEDSLVMGFTKLSPGKRRFSGDRSPNPLASTSLQIDIARIAMCGLNSRRLSTS